MAHRFLLASFDYLRPKDPSISLASSSLLASLVTKLGNKLDIFHTQYNVRRADAFEIRSQFERDLYEIKPNFVGVGIYIWNDHFIQEAVKNAVIDKEIKCKIICGGPQITYNNHCANSLEIAYPFGDIFIRGYAEESLVKVVENLMGGNEIPITGVHYKGRPDPGQKSIYNFDTLPAPLLMDTLTTNPSFPPKNIHKGFIRLETKRGCPFTCAFCQHKDSYEKRATCEKNRTKQEIQWLVEQGINDVSIVDPIFNSGGTNYLDTMQYFLDYGFKGRLSLQSRFEMVSPQYLVMCSKLLETGINVELEFGVQTINKEECKVIQRANNVKKIIQVSQDLIAREIPFETSLIYGLPLQTISSFRFGLDWLLEFVKPSIAVHAWPLMLLKGTPLFEVKDKFGLVERVLNEDLEEVDEKRIYSGIPHVVKSSTFDEKEWNEMKQLAKEVLETYAK